MRRRRFIASAGIIGTAALAGCVSNNDETGDGGGNGDENGGDNSGENGGDNGDENGSSSVVPRQRVDEPPHDPEEPPEDNWDEHWLGDGMATEPSLPFETVTAQLSSPQLGEPTTQAEFVATAIRSTGELESMVDMETAPDRLGNVDFSQETVVVVEDGYGSSSVDHSWQRVEDVDSGVYLHGYRTDPSLGTDDYTRRHSVLIVETALDSDDPASVSLTIGADERVNFDSDEGVVEVDRDQNSAADTVSRQRVDEPPHSPEQPARDNWDEHWLGDGMATEPSLPFETVAAQLSSTQLQGYTTGEAEFAATVVGSPEALESVIDTETAPEQLETVDFSQETVVVVEDGYGSSSVGHSWQRVESTDNGIHLHGYRTDPQVQTTDFTSRHSVLVVEIPADEVDRAGVSLTIGENERVNFDSSEGVVAVKKRD
jgi:hypothetical protein